MTHIILKQLTGTQAQEDFNYLRFGMVRSAGTDTQGKDERDFFCC